MLLDRKRINRWAKWVALFLAVIFAVGFLFMGVGYGGAGFNLSSVFTGDDEKSSASQTPEEKLAAFQAVLTKNPADIPAMLGIAGLLQDAQNYTAAAVYLENVIALDPSRKELYIRLANLYMNQDVLDYQSAVTVLNKATTVDANNPDVYLKLGSAQNNLGNTQAAVLAWQKYLDLAPNGDMAATVKDEITKLAAQATSTTAGVTTTTATSTP